MAGTDLTDAHYHVFGYITHVYAKIERGFTWYIGWRLHIPPNFRYLANILVAPYSARDFRNVAKALHKELPMDEPDHSRFIEMIGEFKRISRLRNHIAHNLWTAGKRPGSIKPMHARISEDRLDVFGADDDEEDFLLEDFTKEAKRLEKLQAQFIEFYLRWGGGPPDDALEGFVTVESSEITSPRK